MAEALSWEVEIQLVVIPSAARAEIIRAAYSGRLSRPIPTTETLPRSSSTRSDTCDCPVRSASASRIRSMSPRRMVKPIRNSSSEGPDRATMSIGIASPASADRTSTARSVRPRRECTSTLATSRSWTMAEIAPSFSNMELPSACGAVDPGVGGSEMSVPGPRENEPRTRISTRPIPASSTALE